MFLLYWAFFKLFFGWVDTFPCHKANALTVANKPLGNVFPTWSVLFPQILHHLQWWRHPFYWANHRNLDRQPGKLLGIVTDPHRPQLPGEAKREHRIPAAQGEVHRTEWTDEKCDNFMALYLNITDFKSLSLSRYENVFLFLKTMCDLEQFGKLYFESNIETFIFFPSSGSFQTLETLSDWVCLVHGNIFVCIGSIRICSLYIRT